MRCAALLLLAAPAHGLTEEYVRTNVHSMFRDFKETHGRKYASAAEEESRLAIFTRTMLEAARLERENPLATFGMNKFSDWNDDEMATLFGNTGVATDSPTNIYSAEEAAKTLATSFDWRDKNVVTAVKDQGKCGSCWTFGTTGSIEGAWAMAGHNLTSLSEQELVSCDAKKCAGGSVSAAINWLVKNRDGKVPTEKSFPYTSGTGKTEACKTKDLTIGATVKGCTQLPRDEDQIRTWVEKGGPVQISVDAKAFHSYKGGIMTNQAMTNCKHDHSILIVGYGVAGDDTPAYWIVKNSWGSSWGESGYIRLKYGDNQANIKCNVWYAKV